MATGGDLVPITVYVRTDTRERLEEDARGEDRNISYVARRILEENYSGVVGSHGRALGDD